LLELLGYTNEKLLQVGSDKGQMTVFFGFPADFVSRLAVLNDEELMEIAKSWANEAMWECADINPFDLAGFLLELRLLCKTRPEWGETVCCALDYEKC